MLIVLAALVVGALLAWALLDVLTSFIRLLRRWRR